ncbi:MAG: polysaccharide deacetylase family protein, partial [Alphaproteobacteria bacterium]|nr:polysaccharide deacetylase family protein [Alphaproteobacteria bacterium]
EQHPELIREIVRRGHQIGNHTWSHPQASFWCHGPIRTYREIARCQSAIKAITGAAPTVFRAPVGHSNLFVHPVLEKFGLRLAGWSSRG